MMPVYVEKGMLPTRTFNALINLFDGARFTLQEIASKTEEELLACRELGEGGLADIIALLQKHDLSLASSERTERDPPQQTSRQERTMTEGQIFTVNGTQYEILRFEGRSAEVRVRGADRSVGWSWITKIKLRRLLSQAKRQERNVLGSANELIDSIIDEIETHFRTFGGDRQPTENPISEAMKGKPLVFAAGVDVRDVVEIVAGLTLNHLMEKMKAEQTRRKKDSQ